jgi:repressor LexA
VFVAEKGYSPNIRELGRLCSFSSTSTTHWHLDILRKGGYVTWHDGCPRTIVITGAGIEAMKAAIVSDLERAALHRTRDSRYRGVGQP